MIVSLEPNLVVGGTDHADLLNAPEGMGIVNAALEPEASSSFSKPVGGKNNRFHIISDENIIYRPGPRIGECLEESTGPLP